MGSNTIRFSQMRTFGAHLYRDANEVAKIVFENEELGIRKTIIDDDGRILDFPGVLHPEVILLYTSSKPVPIIRFRSEIIEIGGAYALKWQIQPDGRYWEDDDGFGMTADDEIDLYARLNEKGEFTEPFQLYSIGDYQIHGTNNEESLAHLLHRTEDPAESLKKQAPGMLERVRMNAGIPKEVTVVFYIPGTVYEIFLSLEEDCSEWFVKAGLRKLFTSSTMIDYVRYAPLDELRTYLKTEEAVADAEKTLLEMYRHAQQKDSC